MGTDRCGAGRASPKSLGSQRRRGRAWCRASVAPPEPARLPGPRARIRQGRVGWGLRQRWRRPMMEQARWIGIDVAKGWLDVASTTQAGVVRFTNDAAGVAALVAAV